MHENNTLKRQIEIVYKKVDNIPSIKKFTTRYNKTVKVKTVKEFEFKTNI